MAGRTAPVPPDTCAVCGADIPPNARACPDCGADERTGWREDSIYDGLDLPDDAWNDESSHTDRPQPARNPETGLAWYWTAVALALVIAAIVYVLRLL